MAYVVIFIVLLVVSAASYIALALPNVGEPENIKVELTPKRIQRGTYLANHVTVCVDCHSTRKWNEFAAPIDSAIIGAGGEKFDAAVGFPGTVYVPNITPAHLKDWTDGELFRAITAGVKKDGSAIFPIMPWQYYATMDREDVYSIIAYIRTLKSVKTTFPKRELDFPLNLLVNTMPQKAALGKIPAESDTIKYGAYLVAAAACRDCHTKDDKGKPLPGMDFAGGHEYTLPGATLHSSNITPDKATGIGNWTKEQFVSRFTQYANGTAKPYSVKPGDFQTIMPWWKYGGMKPSDLEAMYAYLKTVKPVNNRVVKFQANSAAVVNSK